MRISHVELSECSNVSCSLHDFQSLYLFPAAVSLMMAEYHQELFYHYALLLCVFRPGVFGLTLGHWSTNCLICCYTVTVSGMGSISLSGPFAKLDTVWLLPQALCHHCSSVYCRQDTICRYKGLQLGWSLCFSFDSMQSAFCLQGTLATSVKV